MLIQDSRYESSDSDKSLFFHKKGPAYLSLLTRERESIGLAGTVTIILCQPELVVNWWRVV